MAAVAHGDIHVILGQSPPTYTMYGPNGTTLGSGYVSPNLDEASLTVGFVAREIVGTSGDIVARRATGAYIEASFTLRPSDTGGSQTVADALKAATLPGAGFSFTITGMHKIKAGGFDDAFNTTEQQIQPWFVEPGASLRGPAQEAAIITLTARRYLGITSSTPVAEVAS